MWVLVAIFLVAVILIVLYGIGLLFAWIDPKFYDDMDKIWTKVTPASYSFFSLVRFGAGVVAGFACCGLAIAAVVAVFKHK